MKILFSFLVACLISTGTHAAQRLSYSGHFVFGTGGIQTNTPFSGQFSFNPNSPDDMGFSQEAPPYTGFTLGYSNNPASSVAINGGLPVVGDGRVVLGFDNNKDVTQAMIDAVGLTDKAQPGQYDQANLFDAANVQFNGSSFDGTFFGIYGIFAADTFNADDIQNQNYQRILDLDVQPLFVFFRTETVTNGVPVNLGIGIVDHFELTAVPLPGSVWLFGSALIGLIVRSRKGV